MISLRKQQLVIGLLVVLGAAAGAHAADQSALAAEIRPLLAAPNVARMRIGVRIECLAPEHSVVFDQNGTMPLKPASNEKIITGGAALTLLPQGFTYRTLLARRGQDLVIIGAGDPSSGDPRLAKAAKEPITAIFHQWAERLKAAGVTTVAGDLLFDDSVFEAPGVNANWKGHFNLETWYAAPVGGLNFNDNCVDVVIKPGAKGQPAAVTLIPDTTWIELKNTTQSASKGQPVVKRLGSGPLTLSVSGPVSAGNDPDDPLSVAVIDPGAFFAGAARAALSAKGIKIVGTTRRQKVRLPDGSLPPDVVVVATYERKLTDILWRINKNSLNMFAEAMMKTVGAYGTGDKPVRVGSYETGRAAIQQFVKQIGASAEGCVFDDGSGLSHSNRATAALMTAVLAHMDRHPLRDVWLDSMAEPGEQNTTMRRQMKELKGHVFAKTGTINGVSALSGYVMGPQNRRYAFSILCNDTQRAKGGTSTAHQLQEAICRKLATWTPAAVAKGG